ncbi:MAG: S9 family peptidase [Pyrinomonadaceae bacterium]|nr:S9 family peptidase [Pyrinomonadaceae bacterium]
MSATLILNVISTTAQNMNQTKPPVIEKKLKVTEINGYKLEDNYFWLREKKNPEVLKHLEAENAYTTAKMASTEAFQKSLYDEMLGRIKQTDTSVLTKNGDFEYYTRTEDGKQYPVYCRKKIGDKTGREIVLLDVNELAKDLKFYSVGAFEVSDDGNFLAFTNDTTGYRQYTLHVKDLRNNTMLSDKIERVGSVEWATDNKTLFYTTEDDVTKRSDKFFKHEIGTTKSDLLYTEKDELFDIGAGRSRDKKMIFVASYAKTSTEFRYLPADKPNVELKIVLPRRENHEYSVDYYNNDFYIRTNDKAKNFRVAKVAVNDAANETKWQEFIAHNLKVKIEGVDFFDDYAVVSERENGLEFLRVIDLKSNKSSRIATPEPVYSMGLGSNPESNVTKIRYAYNSMVTSPSVYEYDFKTGKSTIIKQTEVLGGYDSKDYESQRVFVTARDGKTKIPVALVYKKGVKFDGNAPMLLYAYGSYGVSIPPTFSSARLSLLNRGVIFAIASIRGGGELGEEWREEGRMFKKINTFTDFVDCADYFVKNKFTSSEKLAIQGGSAGGLLMGAVANMRPDLFKAVVAQVPFVDVMNTMLDASLPLTTSEYTEWGNPNEKPAFDYMIKYSPYDNVKAQKYPNMLIEVSLNDSQVPYWEGAKLAAKIRELKTNDSDILVKVNLGAGHGGSSGRYDKLREVAFDYAYVLSQIAPTR